MDTKHQVLKLAEKVAKNLVLVDIYLKEISSSRTADQDLPPKRANISMSTSVSLMKQDKPEIFPFDIRFTINAINIENNETVFHIDMNFCVTYRAKEQGEPFVPSDEEMKAFGETNVVFNTWPYAREMVHNTMARMNLPVFLIPSIKIGDFVAFQQKSSELNPA